MAKHVVMVPLDVQVHERLHRMRNAISDETRHKENSLGLCPTIGLLLDWWEKSPPDFQWLKQQVELYPKRGRPRKTEAAELTPRIAGKRDPYKGHDVVYRSRHGEPHALMVCKNCSLEQMTDLSALPAFTCPAKFGWSTTYVVKRWTKRELIARLHFEPHEVEWATDEAEPEQPKNQEP